MRGERSGVVVVVVVGRNWVWWGGIEVGLKLV